MIEEILKINFELACIAAFYLVLYFMWKLIQNMK